MKKLAFLITFLFILDTFINLDVLARPGGGSSFRSSRSYSSSSSKSYSSSSYKSKSYSSSSYSSSSSYKPNYSSGYSSNTYNSSNTGTYASTSEPTFEEMLIGFAVFIGLIILFIYINYLIIRYVYRKAKSIFFSGHNKNYDTFKKVGTTEEMSNISSSEIESLIEQFKEKDENFSKVLFYDFVNSLYHKFYTSYGDKKKLNNLKAFINPNELEEQTKGQGKISSVIIGSIDIIDVKEKDDKDLIVVEIDANYTLDNKGYQIKYLILEKWCFMREKGVLSKEPEQMRNISCPSCGGANDLTDAGACTYCGVEIVRGKMQWALKSRVVVLHEQFLENENLGTDVQEEGTELETIKQVSLSENINKFQENNSLSDFDSYFNSFTDKTVKPFILNLYNRWSNNKIDMLRPFISDRLYESFDFWLKDYAQKSLNNRVDGVKINKIELAKVEIDKFYEAITVRIFIHCFDYTELNGKITAGSRSKVRKFTEYWTFIRKTGVELNNLDFDPNNCPSCGAPIAKKAQSAKCEYCGSVTNQGDFSWTLVVITQDETYKG
ncbi:MAG: TIM44-like domain-containing protein [Candidatus Sericytochromatia bacterium]